MNTENAQMKAKLAGLEDAIAKKRSYAEGLCTAIRGALNPALKEVDDMDIAVTANQMDQLVMTQAEILSITADIEKINRMLG